MNDADRTHQFGHVERQGGHQSVLDLAGYAGTGQNADTGIDRDRLFDRFDVIEFHRRLNMDAPLTQRLINGFPDRQVFFESDEFLFGKVFGVPLE